MEWIDETLTSLENQNYLMHTHKDIASALLCAIHTADSSALPWQLRQAHSNEIAIFSAIVSVSVWYRPSSKWTSLEKKMVSSTQHTFSAQTTMCAFPLYVHTTFCGINVIAMLSRFLFEIKFINEMEFPN